MKMKLNGLLYNIFNSFVTPTKNALMLLRLNIISPYYQLSFYEA